MPYIEKKRRVMLRTLSNPTKPGELNWSFADTIDSYLQKQGVNYDSLNAVIGALECCKLEIYRRIAVPYEEKKLEENGEVFDVIKN